MTEEIIIDGVNVAGCVQLIEEPFYPCGLGGECKGWENCYYKQLIRLEQENKELKSDVLKWQKAFSRQYQINENKGYSKAEENYRSALEEIREKVKNPIVLSCFASAKFVLEQIENKINECLGE